MMSVDLRPVGTLGNRQKGLPPGPLGLPILGSLLEAKRGPLSMFVRHWNTYGDIVSFKFGPINYTLILTVEAVNRVLLDNSSNYTKGRNYKGLRYYMGRGSFTSEGAEWKKSREQISPGFKGEIMANYSRSAIAEASQTVDKWKDGDRVEILSAMKTLAFCIVGKALYGVDLADRYQEFSKAQMFSAAYAARHAESVVRTPLWLPSIGNRKFASSLRVLDQLAFDIIDRKIPRSDGATETNMLDILEGWEDETPQVRRRRLRDEVITELLAGYKTTASLLTWAFYLLSKNPNVEQRLRAEINSVLKGGDVTVEALSRLEYMKQVINEVLRIYPPGWAFERQATNEDVVDGYTIPAGGIVCITPYLMHRNPKYWQNPEGFDPERFSREQSAGRPRGAFLPFGVGPRTCAGKHFALSTASIVLATVMRDFRLDLMPGQDIKPVAGGTLDPSPGVWMRLYKIQKSAPNE